MTVIFSFLRLARLWQQRAEVSSHSSARMDRKCCCCFVGRCVFFCSLFWLWPICNMVSCETSHSLLVPPVRDDSPVIACREWRDDGCFHVCVRLETNSPVHVHRRSKTCEPRLRHFYWPYRGICLQKIISSFACEPIVQKEANSRLQNTRRKPWRNVLVVDQDAQVVIVLMMCDVFEKPRCFLAQVLPLSSTIEQPAPIFYHPFTTSRALDLFHRECLEELDDEMPTMSLFSSRDSDVYRNEECANVERESEWSIVGQSVWWSVIRLELWDANHWQARSPWSLSRRSEAANSSCLSSLNWLNR